MKKKLLLTLSSVCLAVALILIMVVPIFASEAANIEKSQSPIVGGQITTTITVTNTNPAGGHSEDFVTIWDTIYHNNGGPLETSPELLTPPEPGVGPVTLGPGAVLVGGVVTLDPGEWVSVSYTWTVLDGDKGTDVLDVARAEGYPTGTGPVHTIVLQVPDWSTIPVPELSAGILFGMGTLGLGGFIWIRRRKSATEI